MALRCCELRNEANESGHTAILVDARRESVEPLYWREEMREARTLRLRFVLWSRP